MVLRLPDLDAPTPIVEDLLAEASLGASAIAGVVAGVNRATPPPDRLAPDRIVRGCEGDGRYLQDRNGSRLEQAMTRLDQEQATAETRERLDDIPADVAVRNVQEPPETWRKAEEGSGR